MLRRRATRFCSRLVSCGVEEESWMGDFWIEGDPAGATLLVAEKWDCWCW